MDGLKALYRRVFGADGLKLLGLLFLFAAGAGLLILAREVFGKAPMLLFLGGVVVFTAGAYFGMWLERRRISELLGVEVKFGL